MNRAVLLLVLSTTLSACRSGDSPAPPGRGSEPAASRSDAVPAASADAAPTTPFSLPKPEELERRSLAPLPLTMLVRPGLEVRAFDDRNQGGLLGIQIVYPKAFSDGAPYMVQIEPSTDPSENLAKHKEWLFKHSERKDIVVLHEDASSLVYEATEERVGRTCATWASKRVGDDTWFAYDEATSIQYEGDTERRWTLPPSFCGDLVVMVRSLEPATKTKK